MRLSEKSKVKNYLYAVIITTLVIFKATLRTHKGKKRKCSKFCPFFQVVLCGYNNFHDDYAFIYFQKYNQWPGGQLCAQWLYFQGGVRLSRPLEPVPDQ